MLLLLCRQGAWPNKRPRPMPAGPGGKDVVVEILAHDSSHGPAEAGHVVAGDFAHGFDHETPVPRQPCKIKRCADVSCSLRASRTLAMRFGRKPGKCRSPGLILRFCGNQTLGGGVHPGLRSFVLGKNPLSKDRVRTVLRVDPRSARPRPAPHLHHQIRLRQCTYLSAGLRYRQSEGSPFHRRSFPLRGQNGQAKLHADLKYSQLSHALGS